MDPSATLHAGRTRVTRPSRRAETKRIPPGHRGVLVPPPGYVLHDRVPHTDDEAGMRRDLLDEGSHPRGVQILSARVVSEKRSLQDVLVEPLGRHQRETHAVTIRMHISPVVAHKVKALFVS
eukprot:1085222-Prorocentrum_minimum.AAC.1